MNKNIKMFQNLKKLKKIFKQETNKNLKKKSKFLFTENTQEKI